MIRPAWIAENERRKSPLNEWRMNGDDDRIMNAMNVEKTSTFPPGQVKTKKQSYKR